MPVHYTEQHEAMARCLFSQCTGDGRHLTMKNNRCCKTVQRYRARETVCNAIPRVGQAIETNENKLESET